MFFYDTGDEDRRAHKAAVLLAKSRYNQTLARFVGQSEKRLAFVADDIERICRECAEETGADPGTVEASLRQIITEQVSVTDGDGVLKNVKKIPEEGQADAHMDIKATEGVLEEEAMTPDERQSLACFRCEAAIEAGVVCEPCESAIKQADLPLAEDAEQQCPAPGCTFRGTEEEIAYHVGKSHPELQATADVAVDEDDPDSPAEEAENAEESFANLPEEDEEEAAPNLASVFDETVALMANERAAREWSVPGEQDVQEISAEYGLDPEVVQSNLKIVATFGEVTAMNGEIGSEDGLEGFSELDAFGGRVPSADQQIETQAAVDATAQKLSMESDGVYSAVVESYGDDLGDMYHVPVQGEARYYLPSKLIHGHGEPTEAPQAEVAQV